MMYGKSLILYCILPIIASSSKLWSNLASDNEENDYSTMVRYHLDANTMKNYDDGEDWYNLHKNYDDGEDWYNFTKNEAYIKIDSSFMIVFFCGELGVILSSLMMFIVYSILPELQNIHGFILRRYSGSVFVAYTIFLIIILNEKDALGYYIYIIFGYSIFFVFYYAFFGSYLWLNVMSFNIWHTFRQMHSSQSMTKQEEKKMLKFYSIYAWGVPFNIYIPIFVAVILDNFRFLVGLAYWLYGIFIISVISSICLSFLTARKIAYFEKNIAHRLSNSEKQRYDDQKQWFKMQLEVTIVLFTIICIQTCIIIIYVWVYMYVLYNDNDNDNITLYAIQYTSFALDVIQHFYIFIIFVWKKKIRQLFLKRLSCQSCGIFSATQHAIVSSNNRSTISTMTLP